ncbi:hypothetical protein AAY473_037867 [Plecturocebus cupreus]
MTSAYNDIVWKKEAKALSSTYMYYLNKSTSAVETTNKYPESKMFYIINPLGKERERGKIARKKFTNDMHVE